MAVYCAELAEGKQIGEEPVIGAILSTMNLPAETVLARAKSDATKVRLREQTDEAMRLGIFGAPSFVTQDGELFWGNDRLEAALDWATEHQQSKSETRSAC